MLLDKFQPDIEQSFVCKNYIYLKEILLKKKKPTYKLETYYTYITSDSEIKFIKIYDYKNQSYIYKKTIKKGKGNNRKKLSKIITKEDYEFNKDAMVGIKSIRYEYKDIEINGYKFDIFLWEEPKEFNKLKIITAEIENINSKLDKKYFDNIFIDVTNLEISRGKYIHYNPNRFIIYYKENIIKMI